MIEHVTTRGDLFDKEGPRYLPLHRLLEIDAELVGMAAVLFRFRGSAMFPPQTYAAIVYSVKSNFYAAAWCKVLERPCYLYQVADDREESWFGSARTASASGQTMDAADFEILASKVAAVEVILADDETLRARHSRLCSREMDRCHPEDMRSDLSGEAAIETSDLKPLSEYWERGIAASRLTLEKCVRTSGEERTGKWLKMSDLDLRGLEEREGLDMECPQKRGTFAGVTDWGEQVYNDEEKEVLAADDEREKREKEKEEEEEEKEEEEEEDSGDGGTEGEEEELSRADATTFLDAIAVEEGLDDALASEGVDGHDSDSDGMGPTVVKRNSHGLVNGEDYKDVSLAHLLKLHLGGTSVGSKDRLRKYMEGHPARVEAKRVSLRNKRTNLLNSEREESDEVDQTLTLETPVFALVTVKTPKSKSASAVSLVFGLPLSFSTKTAAMTESERGKTGATIDLVLFKQRPDGRGNVLLSTGSGSTVTTKASFVVPIDPDSAYDGEQNHIWSVKIASALSAGTSMFKHVQEDFRSLLHLGPGMDAVKLMCVDKEGELLMVIEGSEAILKKGGDLSCVHCNVDKFKKVEEMFMIKHVGAHILNRRKHPNVGRQLAAENPCLLCGAVKAVGKGEAGGCVNFVLGDKVVIECQTFDNGGEARALKKSVLEKFSANQPCCNVPMECFRCHNWFNRYTMEDHITDTCEVGGAGNVFGARKKTLSTEEEFAFLLTADQVKNNLEMLTRFTLATTKVKNNKRKKGEGEGEGAGSGAGAGEGE